MRLGLVTDIHNQSSELAKALRLFRDRGVDQVVTIGDTCDAFTVVDGAGAVAEALAECRAIGVWGNHDFALCRDVPDIARERYPAVVLDVMARMEPRLVVDGCHFSHMEACVDPTDVAQLWDRFEVPIELMERAARGWAAEGSRWQFVGHYHRWWAATPAGPIDWTGTQPLRLPLGQRAFVIVAAVCDGWCAILDTATGHREPLRCLVPG
ncbi:MAG: metallophosphoesterase family protein [Planctomycetota bacterium]